MANKFLWRTNQLINLLPEDCDGALIMSQINGRYFTGFNCDNGYFIVTRGDCVYVTDSRYTEAARKAIGWCEVTEYAGPKMKECFGGIAAGLGLKKLLQGQRRDCVHEGGAEYRRTNPDPPLRHDPGGRDGSRPRL